MADSADSEYRDLKLDVKEQHKRGIHAIKRLPITRRTRQVTPPPILRDLLDLLQGYLASPSHYAPPLKSLLFDAVISLLPKGRKNLSTQWSKMHLCLALKKWVISALRLPNYDDQPDLMMLVNRNPANTKELSHTVFLSSETHEGETLTFCVASPSPVKKPTAASAGSPANSPNRPLSPSSLMPDGFMDEIDAMAGETSMAEFPTIFYTPGVPTLNLRLARGDITPDGAGRVSGLGRS